MDKEVIVDRGSLASLEGVAALAAGELPRPLSVEMTLIAQDFGLDVPGVLEAMRTGRLTSVWETGMAEGGGRSRVTFFHENRQLRLIVDANGEVIERALSQPRSLRERLTTLEVIDERPACAPGPGGRRA